MAIKPMLFNTEMVQAILDERKTVTRRVVKPQPPATSHVSKVKNDYGWSFWKDNPEKHYMKRPYRPGDILWVRETWSQVYIRQKRYLYKADADRGVGEGANLPIRWHPSIHMPQEAARIFLRVTDVRAERLQDMSIGDILNEGFVNSGELFSEIYDAKERFFRVWDSTIKPADRPTYGWEANPWVWVIEFERCEKPEGWPW